MSVDFKKLKQLREETGISFSFCKRALEETDNDIKKAKEKLKEWGATRAQEKSDRATGDGGIFSYVHHNKKVAALVELACETDFVSGNAEFQTLGAELAMQAASLPSKDEKAFLEQVYIRDPSKKINDLIKDAVLKFGENIKVKRILRWTLGG
jgi:elongation factor Ts